MVATTLSRNRAITEVVATAGIWGVSFIAQRWALVGTGPLWVTAGRFLVAVMLTIPFVLSFPSVRQHLRLNQLALAFLPGLLLGLHLTLQTFGLRYTSVANSAFITVLYVLWVPIFDQFIGKKSIPTIHWFWVFIALGGTTFISRPEKGGWNFGDILTLGASIAGALQIFWIDKIVHRIESPLTFNILQAVCAGLLAMICGLMFEPIPNLAMPPISIAGILILALGSTLIGFWIQLRAQQVLSSSLVSLLFLLESPLAAFFGYLIFAEQMTGSQWIGAFLILAATFGAIRCSK
ncbi:MAG: DMT family transporter [Deltaproteobacteria bacterium]|nr:DMT family transporter [Deltaproteobacteria bacterium]